MEAVLGPTSPQTFESQEKRLLRAGEQERHEGRLRFALAGFLLLLATALLCTIVMEEDAEQLLPADLLKSTKVSAASDVSQASSPAVPSRAPARPAGAERAVCKFHALVHVCAFTARLVPEKQ